MTQINARGIDQLLQVMERLRDPEHGCPWDIKQTLTSLIPYTIEEAYEVAGALTEGEPEAIKDELGDLLFQVVFYAHLTQETFDFCFDDIAAGMAAKLIRRHPHVFGDAFERQLSEAEIKANWETIKKQERTEKKPNGSVFDGVPNNLPALLKAGKLQKRAASVGFDWQTASPILAKVAEELEEVAEEVNASIPNPDRIEDEIGDLLFAVTNLARHQQINPETALARANQKFQRRFQAIEARLQARNLDPQTLSLEALESHWQAVKRGEK